MGKKPWINSSDVRIPIYRVGPLTQPSQLNSENYIPDNVPDRSITLTRGAYVNNYKNRGFLPLQKKFSSRKSCRRSKISSRAWVSMGASYYAYIGNLIMWISSLVCFLSNSHKMYCIHKHRNFFFAWKCSSISTISRNDRILTQLSECSIFSMKLFNLYP